MEEKTTLAEIGDLISMTEAERGQIKIFISHRHENKDYADAIRTELLEWGFTNERVHQSSSSRAKGPKAGDGLNEAIKEFLYECHLVIFIYTRKEFSWEWCSYEMGVAENPRITIRIVPFQIFNDIPKTQSHLLTVKVERPEIQKFVLDFHKQPDFFPGYGTFSPTTESEVLDRRATRLYEALDQAKQKDPYSTETVAKRDLRYGYFRVKIDGEDLNTLYDRWNDSKGPQISIEEVRTSLRENLKITGSEGWSLFHFGVSEGQEEKPVSEEWSLERLENQWKESLEKEPAGSWLEEIIDDIWGFRNANPPKLSWKPFESIFSKELFYPVVMHTYMGPDGSREYDIYTILIKENGQ